MTTSSSINIDDALAQANALITNTHVVYTTGMHGSIYFNKDAIYAHPDIISGLCHTLAEQFYTEGVNVVIGPALGGIILAQWTAHHMTTLSGVEVLAGYAEKTTDGKNFVIKRGYGELIGNKRVLVVEDVLNTGYSIHRVVQLCRSLGAELVGVGALCNYDPIETLQKAIGVEEIYSLYPATRSRWEEAECPLCKTGVPINTKVGKGLEFLSHHQSHLKN